MRMAMNAGLSKVVCCLFLSVSFVAPSRAGQYEECVGRYQLGLPGEVDAATTTPRVFGKKDVDYPIQFDDGQPAVLSSFLLDGEFEIARGLTLHDYLALKADVKERLERAGRENDDLIRTEMSTDRGDSYAYFGAASSGFNLYQNGEIVTFRVASYGDDPETGKQRVKNALNGLSFRQDYEIPKRNGACLPGVFVASDGTERREIGVTFRLKEHPDVTIFFKDNTSTVPPKTVSVQKTRIGRQKNLTSREKNEFVWTYSGLGKKVKLAHDPIPFHSVELDGRKGVGSFGTITRDDGSTDYGYLATVQGDPKAAVDTPDLTLLVERTAKNARGKAPMSPDELKQIAKDIAASIKRRPVH